MFSYMFQTNYLSNRWGFYGYLPFTRLCLNFVVDTCQPIRDDLLCKFKTVQEIQKVHV